MSTHYINAIDLAIQNKHLLNHEFYQAWSRGELPIECLREYASEYYQHVKAFPTYLSAIHSHTDDIMTRRVLLQNLIEEEAGFPNHPDLWKSFAMAIGVSEGELVNYKPSKTMADLILTFHTICSKHTTAEGIAALYAYESQIPEISASKIEGLKEHYGMQNPEDWAYFSVHIEADKEHAAQERSLLARYLNKENQEIVATSVNKVLTVLWNFLSDLCHKYTIGNDCCAKFISCN